MSNIIETYAKQLDIEIPLELRDYVVAIIQGESNSSVHTIVPVHPTGFPILLHIYGDIPVVHIGSETLASIPRLAVNGQISRSDITLEIKGKFGQLGLLLHPSATYYLFHKPGSFFVDQCQSLVKMPLINTENLESQILETKAPEESIPILFDFMKGLLKKRLPPIKWLDVSLAKIFESNGRVALNELAMQSGISLRHFRRKFKEVVGVPPKYFCKIIQINTLFDLLESSNPQTIHRLALDCGYYDQSHFIKDFNRLIGESPTNFLNGKLSFIQSYLGRKGN